MMIHFDYVTEESTQEQNPHWPQSPGNPYGIASGYGLEKQTYYLI